MAWPQASISAAGLAITKPVQARHTGTQMENLQVCHNDRNVSPCSVAGMVFGVRSPFA